MEKYNALIIHNENYAPDRVANVKELQTLFPNNHVIKAIFPADLTKEDREFALNPKLFHAMPVLYKFPDRIIGKYCYYLSYKKALEYAYTNELDNVIIFEDDAVLIDNDFDFINFLETESINLITYLGGCIKPNTNFVYCTHAIYYPDYAFIGYLLNEIENSNNKRATDCMLVNIVQKKNINYDYLKVFNQIENGWSYIDNAVKKKAGNWVNNCKNAI
jgi:GR25 family glycosyltransferase involved in LPS biosynthesis